ncbi:hypothetical protein HNY73_007275 [Argiope bruennichi]|uniref:Uncharacterized protein n=1 Tax=Argiope bruennichi TaxID=94029 RepID=A0A8T0FDG4_ARGBR|nr:hypothetical protein HNY73_007275 [Argiope bruennichi]
MEEHLDSLLERRKLALEFMRENRRFSKRCCNVVLLRDRMRKWCEDLLDDLTLIDSEDLDRSTYRSSVNYMATLIKKCWRDIEVNLTGVYKDVGWLHENLNKFEQDFIDLWWMMAEDVNKRQQRIEDFISRFHRLHLLFKEMVEAQRDWMEENQVK